MAVLHKRRARKYLDTGRPTAYFFNGPMQGLEFNKHIVVEIGDHVIRLPVNEAIDMQDAIQKAIDDLAVANLPAK